MAKSYFETLIEPELAKCESEALGLAADTPEQLGMKLARLKGRSEGLKASLEIYRKAMRQDIEDAA